MRVQPGLRLSGRSRVWPVLLSAALAIGGSVASAAETEPQATGSRRRAAPSPVQVEVQGRAGKLEPVRSAPAPLIPPMERKRVAVSVGAPSASVRQAQAAPAFRAVSLAEGEGTLEIDGVSQLVRAGTRLGRDTVKAVGPGRIVLERAPAPGERGGVALLIVTFDGKGGTRTRTFFAQDDTAPEAKRP
jgi:hypothetical protein